MNPGREKEDCNRQSRKRFYEKYHKEDVRQWMNNAIVIILDFMMFVFVSFLQFVIFVMIVILNESSTLLLMYLYFLLTKLPLFFKKL